MSSVGHSGSSLSWGGLRVVASRESRVQPSDLRLRRAKEVLVALAAVRVGFGRAVTRVCRPQVLAPSPCDVGGAVLSAG